MVILWDLFNPELVLNLASLDPKRLIIVPKWAGYALQKFVRLDSLFFQFEETQGTLQVPD